MPGYAIKLGNQVPQDWTKCHAHSEEQQEEDIPLDFVKVVVKHRQIGRALASGYIQLNGTEKQLQVF